jgi:hypothetical protein
MSSDELPINVGRDFDDLGRPSDSKVDIPEKKTQFRKPYNVSN